MLQIQGKDRLAVAEAGKQLGLDGTYIARSYIEQVNPQHASLAPLTQAHLDIEVPTAAGVRLPCQVMTQQEAQSSVCFQIYEPT